VKRLFFISLLFPCLCFGQNFGVVGTEWHYSEHAQGACPGNCEYLHLKSIADTVIQAKTTHKIIQTYYTHFGDTVLFDPIYAYEQSDTVFGYNFQKARFLTLYIFNANIGDTLTLDAPDTMFLPDTTYRLVIDTIINTIVDGVPLKKYRTLALDYHTFWNGGYFMDRIGGLDWFFPRGVIIPEAGGPIRCYSDVQIDTSFQAIPCDYREILSIPSLSDNKNVRIYPNPSTGKFMVDGRWNMDDGIQVFDLFGREVPSHINRHTSYIEVDMSHRPKGVYIIRVGEAVRKLVLN